MISLRKTARVVTRCLSVGVCSVLVLSGCASQSDWLSRSGPNVKEVQAATAPAKLNGMQLVVVNDAVARKLLESHKQNLFSGVFASAVQPGYVVGAGDVVEISVWEAPPATLFGAGATDARVGPSTTRVTSFPEQMVNSDGMVNMPFVGQVRAAGRNPQQIEADIARLLKGKANQAQVLVRVIRNATSNVTVVGEVTNSLRMPITAKGERLLDALAAAGGTRQPVNKMTLQMTRGNVVQALPLETIIRDPKQNIVLQPGDVVTALFQPLSYVVLGATGKNEEINFEAQGISLSQALARAGGLKDERADARGVFIFRLEEPTALDWPQPVATTPDGKVPVIYQLDLNDPASFFVAQSFSVNNKDVLYVSNAPAAELQKFLNIVGSVLGPVIGVRAATR
ncbi:polysaccharide biosynthesis/export family protein [Rhodoferax sp.]|uniref:polysaccharide biosynthesis/export family protein n=1 Tax=Rhodoferax sp. TaxID=50421 RepID=UPI0025CFC585|nr:polysaccharide biosynthesis/export family protein [Rhodoferax sp.]